MGRSEDWQAGFALLDLCPVLAQDAARFTRWANAGGRFASTGEGDHEVVVFNPNPLMDWDGWSGDVDLTGRGWSSTEWRLFNLVTAITIRERKVFLTEVFNLGSWERDALAVVVDWASGGNQAERPGRYTIAPRMRSL